MEGSDDGSVTSGEVEEPNDLDYPFEPIMEGSDDGSVTSGEVEEDENDDTKFPIPIKQGKYLPPSNNRYCLPT